MSKVFICLAVLLLLSASFLAGALTKKDQARYTEVIFAPPKQPPGTTLACTYPDGRICPLVHIVEAGYVYDQLEDGRFIREKENGHFLRYKGGKTFGFDH